MLNLINYLDEPVQMSSDILLQYWIIS